MKGHKLDIVKEEDRNGSTDGDSSRQSSEIINTGKSENPNQMPTFDEHKEHAMSSQQVSKS